MLYKIIELNFICKANCWINIDIIKYSFCILYITHL